MRVIAFLIHSLSIIGGVGSVVNRLSNELADKYKIYIIAIQDDSVYAGYNFDSRIEIIHLRIN